MIYEQLTQDEQDDYVSEAMHSREWEHFQHAHNQRVFAEILKTAVPGQRIMPNGEDYAAYIKRLHDEAGAEMANVEEVYGGLAAQLPAGARREAAHARAKIRRLAREAVDSGTPA